MREWVKKCHAVLQTLGYVALADFAFTMFLVLLENSLVKLILGAGTLVAVQNFLEKYKKDRMNEFKENFASNSISVEQLDQFLLGVASTEDWTIPLKTSIALETWKPYYSDAYFAGQKASIDDELLVKSVLEKQGNSNDLRVSQSSRIYNFLSPLLR